MFGSIQEVEKAENKMIEKLTEIMEK